MAGAAAAAEMEGTCDEVPGADVLGIDGLEAGVVFAGERRLALRPPAAGREPKGAAEDPLEAEALTGTTPGGTRLEALGAVPGAGMAGEAPREAGGVGTGRVAGAGAGDGTRTRVMSLRVQAPLMPLRTASSKG